MVHISIPHGKPRDEAAAPSGMGTEVKPRRAEGSQRKRTQALSAPRPGAEPSLKLGMLQAGPSVRSAIAQVREIPVNRGFFGRHPLIRCPSWQNRPMKEGHTLREDTKTFSRPGHSPPFCPSRLPLRALPSHPGCVPLGPLCGKGSFLAPSLPVWDGHHVLLRFGQGKP